VISTSFGILTFASPWVLAGLAALPVIWWLLRLTPPQKQTVEFPPAPLMLDLKATERTPVHSPWWLTLLRMAVAAGVILALAEPTLKPASAVPVVSNTPILVVADTGWAAASRWDKRTAMAQQIAAEARGLGQLITLVPTAGPMGDLKPLTPDAFLDRGRSLEPQAYDGDRGAVAKAIDAAFGASKQRFRVVWLSDGLGGPAADVLADSLRKIADGSVDVVSDEIGAGPLTVERKDGAATLIAATVREYHGAPRVGTVAAETLQGQRLAAVPFTIRAGQGSADVTFDLPLDVRNQVARLSIVSEASAGGVFLLDGRSQRRRVGIVASDDAERAQPLLSPSYYIERALNPYAEVFVTRNTNLDAATAELLARPLSVLILSDVGRITGPARDRLRTFMEKGGTLVRFAGPRLEQGGDDLLPSPLREGGRTFGGSMTWTTPQQPATFEAETVFDGLKVPDDVTVTQQVLSDPSRMQQASATIAAQLRDGTPLVTTANRGAGRSIFFHVTATPEWSNLPLSGLFVDMLRRIVDVSGAAGEGGTAEAAAVAQDTERLLPAWRVLDGYGRLGLPTGVVQPVLSSTAASSRPSQTSPAGLYGPQNATRALNIAGSGLQFAPLGLREGMRTRVYTEARTLMLSPWLFAAALSLFLLEGLLSAFIMGASRLRVRKAAATVGAFVLVAALAGLPNEARADKRPDAPAMDDATRHALQASVETRFAYVLTGDAETDRTSQAGLAGLAKVLALRTAVEPGEPVGVDPARDEIVFFPLLYWPVLSGNAAPLAPAALARVDAYMKQGGLIIFDTKTDQALASALAPASARVTPLSQLLGKLDIPPLQRIPDDHVLTKSFYLLQTFPGRWDSGDLWVEARPADTAGNGGKKALKSDGVSSIIVTSNDLAAAWAVDESDRPMYALVPGGEEQREMSYRVGVNIVMYALTGNYKADQVHVPAILERLGH
jgi:hypothetical protein